MGGFCLLLLEMDSFQEIFFEIHENYSFLHLIRFNSRDKVLKMIFNY